MWRDILIILAFALTALVYFGLTPRQILRYTRTIKGEVGKRGLVQKMVLLFVGLQSIYFISYIIYRFDALSLDDVLFILVCQIFLWGIMLHDIWKLSETGNRIVAIVWFFVALPLAVVAIVFTDMILWQKVTYPIVGFLIGFGLRLLQSYLEKKFKRRS